MSKKKSKTQKKKFFSDPKNKNKVFKKKKKVHEVVAKVDVALRKRGAFVVLPTSECKEIPHCSHGPCLLFGQKEKGNIKSRYFACAVYRADPSACPYKITVDEEFNIIGEEGVPRKIFEDEDAKPETAAAVKYGCIPKKLKTIPETSSLVFCHTCVDVFEAKHRCPSVVVTRAELQLPSRLLAAKDSHSGEAQFFFSDEALGVLQGAVERSNVDGVLCLGAPRLFETLRSDRKRKRHLFLLDYDNRYANFFPAKQFAQYSMLVDHFYDESSPKRLDSFLAECENLLLVCDPPFGAFLDPLMRSIEALKQRHKEARMAGRASMESILILCVTTDSHTGLSQTKNEYNQPHQRANHPCSFFGCIVIPMFVGKHVLRSEKDYWMCDYRVTYANHKVFAKASKTTVRCFTNLKPEVFNLSDVNGYKFCEFCERYVSNNNKHCFMCSACTSKDGSPYKHCERCMRCVKNSYRHCKKCERCHLEGRCLSAGEVDDREE